MILKLTKIDDSMDDLEAGSEILVNTDHVAAIHSKKITRKVPIIGQDNEFIGSVVTLAGSGQAFPVREQTKAIYAMLPYSLTRLGVPALKPGQDPAERSQVI